MIKLILRLVIIHHTVCYDLVLCSFITAIQQQGPKPQASKSSFTTQTRNNHESTITRLFNIEQKMNPQSNGLNDVFHHDHQSLNHEIMLLQQVDQILENIYSYNNNNVDDDDFQKLQTKILQKIDESHRIDTLLYSSFSHENNIHWLDQTIKNIPKYRWITTPTSTSSSGSSNKPFVLQTIDNQNPILNETSIELIRNAAETFWKASSKEEIQQSSSTKTSSSMTSKKTSRFTYQRKGNYEAHLIDLANADSSHSNQIFSVMDEALQERIYPLVRHAFQAEIPDLNHQYQLCIYDSLIIRYNATEANLNRIVSDITMESSTRLGAGQPLHRDLGLVSVNIMLNHPSEFQGGGTFFEKQLELVERSEEIITFSDENSIYSTNYEDASSSSTNTIPLSRPLLPVGVGQAVAHLSSERHAGAGTTQGIRDILVIFLTATTASTVTSARNNNIDTTNKLYPAPCMERAARLKKNARLDCQSEYYTDHPEKYNLRDCEELCIACRIMYLRLALSNYNIDGEAWHYLGMAIRDLFLHNVTKKKSENKHEFLVTNDNNTYEDDDRLNLLHLSIQCLELAHNLVPNDGRLCNNLGLAYETLLQQLTKDSDAQVSSLVDKKICYYYNRSVFLHKSAQKVGCDVENDLDTVCLNYGLYVANKDDFENAVEILNHFRRKSHDANDKRILDACELLRFCEDQIKA